VTGWGNTYTPHVEDLNVVSLCLAADDNIIVVGSDFTPDGVFRVRRQAAQVHHLALLRNFDESRAILLTKCNEFSAIWGNPSPRRRATTNLAAEVGMRQELIKVDLMRSAEKMTIRDE